MLNNRLVKMGVFALVIVSVTIFALGWQTTISSAQEPGGGRGGNGRGGQRAGQGLGLQQNAGQGFGQQQNARQFGTCEYCLANLPPAVPGEVPAEVIEALTAGLTDEHNAYDTYQAITDQLGAIRPFVNIQNAEANHIAALEFLFERYDLDIPEIAPLTDVPQFGSFAEACAAGVAAETANLELYNTWIDTVQDYPDMVQIFTSLRDASEFQHLPAFERCAG